MESLGGSLAGGFTNGFDWLKETVSPREPEKSAAIAEGHPGEDAKANNKPIAQQAAQQPAIASSDSARTVASSAPTNQSPPPKSTPLQKPAAATPSPPALPKSRSGVGSAKLVAAFLLLSALVLASFIAFVRFAPNTPLADTVQSCISQIGLQKLPSDPGSLRKLLQDMPAMPTVSSMPSIPAMPEMPKVASATSFLSKPEPARVADSKNELASSNQGMLETIAYGAGAAITSTIGYGVYWLMTQG